MKEITKQERKELIQEKNSKRFSELLLNALNILDEYDSRKEKVNFDIIKQINATVQNHKTSLSSIIPRDSVVNAVTGTSLEWVKNVVISTYVPMLHPNLLSANGIYERPVQVIKRFIPQILDEVFEVKEAVYLSEHRLKYQDGFDAIEEIADIQLYTSSLLGQLIMDIYQDISFEKFNTTVEKLFNDDYFNRELEEQIQKEFKVLDTKLYLRILETRN